MNIVQSPTDIHPNRINFKTFVESFQHEIAYQAKKRKSEMTKEKRERKNASNKVCHRSRGRYQTPVAEQEEEFPLLHCMGSHLGRQVPRQAVRHSPSARRK